jgi:hypothetical protein
MRRTMKSSRVDEARLYDCTGLMRKSIDCLHSFNLWRIYRDVYKDYFKFTNLNFFRFFSIENVFLSNFQFFLLTFCAICLNYFLYILSSYRIAFNCDVNYFSLNLVNLVIIRE